MEWYTKYIIMKIVLIDTSIPINTRNVKYVESLKQFMPEAEVRVITWNRDNYAGHIPDNYIVYHAIAEYGNAKEKLKKMFGFGKFVHRILKEESPDVIIASHWESLLCTPNKLPNNPLIIYENLDVPTGGTVIRGITRYLESRKLKSVNLIIHASRFFKELYPKSIPQIILENKSKFNFEAIPHEQHKRKVVSYIGTVRYRDILSNFIIGASQVDDVDVEIFGDGQDLNYLQQEFGKRENVRFHGTYSFSDIPMLYSKSDIVWAAYPNKDYNVVYAISNKFHESMMCGVPCIYANNTKLGDYVEKEGIGFVVDPYSVDEIKALITKLAKDEIDLTPYRDRLKAQKDGLTTWDDDFKKVVDFIALKKGSV